MENKTRTIHELVCKYCGRKFFAKRSDAQFCCNACRQQAYLVRSAPRIVSRQLTWIEEEFRHLETRRGYLTKQNLDNLFEQIRELAYSWYFDKLPQGHKLRKYVEMTLLDRLDVLRAKLGR